MNNNKEIIVEYLWGEIDPLLYRFASGLAPSESNVKFTIERRMNEAFLLRGYVSFRRTDVDNEVAILVDVLLKGDQIHLSADACMEDGEIIADGPTEYVVPSIISEFDETLFSEWLKRFGEFLVHIEVVVRERIDLMSP